MLHHGHFVLRQGAGFIRADNLRASKRLHRGQFADDRVALGHIGHTDGKNDCHHRGKPLRNGGNRQRHRNHKGVQHHGRRQPAAAHQCADEIDPEDYHANPHHKIGENFAELTQFLLQRGLAFLRVCQRVGNFTHFGIHTGGNHHGFAAPVHHGTAHKDHIFAVAQRHVAAFARFQRGVGFRDRNGLAGQRRLLDFQAGALDHACVRRDGIARFQHNHVANHQVLTVNLHHAPVTKHLGSCRRNLLQCRDCLFCLALLQNAQRGIDHNHCHNDDHIRGEPPFDCRHHAGNHRRHQQDDGHRLNQLFEKAVNEGLALPLRQFVFAVLFQSRRRLAGAKPPRRGSGVGKNLPGAFQILFHFKTPFPGGTVQKRDLSALADKSHHFK